MVHDSFMKNKNSEKGLYHATVSGTVSGNLRLTPKSRLNAGPRAIFAGCAPRTPARRPAASRGSASRVRGLGWNHRVWDNETNDALFVRAGDLEAPRSRLQPTYEPSRMVRRRLNRDLVLQSPRLKVR